MKTLMSKNYGALTFQYVFFVVMFLAVKGFSLEIPLEGGGKGGAKVAFVDMDIVFQEYPETKKARVKYFKEVVSRRKELDELETETTQIKEQLNVLKATLAELEAISSTDTVVPEIDASSALKEKEDELIFKQQELEASRKTAEQELAAFEESSTFRIYGDLYTFLKQLAEEEGISLVVDKSYVLFGQADIDLTDKLQKRLQGR